MPSITTHHMFSKEILNHLKEDELEHFKEELIIYYTFAQSHDYLFYYTFDLKNSKFIKDLGHHAHHNDTQNYIINIVKEIKEKNLEDNNQVIAYLYGVITHYVLDSTCHPYIFYKTGVYRKNDKKYKKYHGKHNLMEKNLDAIYWEKYTNKKYNKCNLNRDIIKKPIFSQELINLISDVYKKTYNADNIGEFYYKSIKQCKIINTMFINDYFGIKRALYLIIDFITNHHFGYISSFSTHITKPNLEYLNLNHKTWNHPCFKDKKYNYSFEDLYELSIEKALIIIRACNKVLYKNKDIKTLKKDIPNIDYSTGLEIEESRRMDFFE